jgi:hypothetical protein
VGSRWQLFLRQVRQLLNKPIGLVFFDRAYGDSIERERGGPWQAGEITGIILTAVQPCGGRLVSDRLSMDWSNRDALEVFSNGRRNGIGQAKDALASDKERLCAWVAKKFGPNGAYAAGLWEPPLSWIEPKPPTPDEQAKIDRASPGVVAAKAALRSGEKVVGAWIDNTQLFSVVVIVNSGGRLSFFTAFDTGETSRKMSLPGNDSVNVPDDPLRELATSKSGRHTWETPDAKREVAIVLNTETVRYRDRKGDVVDFNRFVEIEDGTLLGWEIGVGDTPGETKKPWFHGRPVSLR